MGRIQVMDEQLANQIAAGEVVERPASVVKELVENAVDAGATLIDVVVEEGGLGLIRVTDNGSGIDADDLQLAFQRHATSKLLSGRDLFRIASLGFRGEALPSIAAVARVECGSSTVDTGLGKRLVIEGGTVTSFDDANTPLGTDFIVRDLFYNTPARLKYMKSIQTELGHISDYMNRLALAHPGIAFTLKHNGNTLLRTTGSGDRLQVIAAVYGTSTAKSMMAVQGDHPDYTLIGYISKPELTKANRNGFTTIVNGRYIRSFVLHQAVMQAYHTLLPIGRFPMGVIDIGMHPSLVDVNVHPSKMEVRFSKEPELRAFVERLLKETLGGMAYIPSAAQQTPRSKPLFVQERISFHQPEPAADAQSKAVSAGHADQAPSMILRDATERLYAPSDKLRPSVEAQNRIGSAPAPAVHPPASAKAEAAAAAESVTEAPPEVSASPPDQAAEESLISGPDKPAFPSLSWIGQLHGTYLLAQNEEGLYMIDQHAAHERINYEYFLRKFSEPSGLSQPLLVPLTLEFTAGEAELVRGRLSAFADAGVELEPFGSQTFLVRAHPDWLPKGEELAIIEEMAEWILSERKAVDIGKLREKSAILCACKASIKANDRRSREEGEALLARLSSCEQPYTCPHGRPILVHISTYQLEKMFKRVMS